MVTGDVGLDANGAAKGADGLVSEIVADQSVAQAAPALVVGGVCDDAAFVGGGAAVEVASLAEDDAESLVSSVLMGVDRDDAAEHADRSVDVAHLHGHSGEVVQYEQRFTRPGVIGKRRVPRALGFGMAASCSVPDKGRQSRGVNTKEECCGMGGDGRRAHMSPK